MRDTYCLHIQVNGEGVICHEKSTINSPILHAIDSVPFGPFSSGRT